MIWNLTGGAENNGVHVTDGERQPHHADGPVHAVVDEGIASDMGIPLSMLPEIRSSSVYGDCKPGVINGVLWQESSRPAGGHVRPSVPRRRYGEEHLRHRQLHAAQHRRGAGAERERPAHHGLLQDRGQADLCPRGIDRHHRALVQWIRDNPA